MKKMKRFLATTLAAAMMLSSTVSAAEWNTEGGSATIIGDSTVTQPVIEVALPGDLAFMIDPYLIDFEEQQIVGGDYNVINYSNVNVEVKVSPSIVELEDVDENDAPVSISVLDVVTTTPGVLDETPTVYKDLAASATDGKKAVYLTAIPADATTDLVDSDYDGIYEFAYTAAVNDVGRAANEYIPETEDTPDAYIYGVATAGDADAGMSVPLTLQKLEATDDDVSFTFVLGKEAGIVDEETDIYTPAANSVASFTVGGAVDPKAYLTDGEVVIQAVYSLATLSKNAMAETTVSTAKQQLKMAAPVTPAP